MSVVTQFRTVDRNYANGFIDGANVRNIYDEYSKVIRFSPDSDRNTRKYYGTSLRQRMSKPLPIDNKELTQTDVEKINQRVAKLNGELQVLETRGNMFGMVDSKIAKLNNPFFHNASSNYEKVIEKKSTTNDFTVEQATPIRPLEPSLAVASQVTPTVTNEKPTDIVIDFNPKELQEKVNASFEGIETAPIKQELPVEEGMQSVSRIPYAERSAKLYLSEDSVKDIAIPVEEKDEAALTTGRIPVFSAEPTIHNERSGIVNGNDYIMGMNSSREDLTVDLNDDIEALVNEVAEAKKAVDAERSAVKEARLENERTTEELKEIQARAEAKRREREKYQQEVERVRKQKEDAERVYQSTLKTTKEKLRADRDRIMEDKRRQEEARQREAELASELWKQRTDTEQKITMIATELPTIQDEIENTRNTIDMIMKRSKEIQSMANVASVEETTEKSDIALFNETLDSIFGDSFSNSEVSSSFSKGRKVA